MTREEQTAIAFAAIKPYIEIAGKLAAIVEWITERDGECLADNPHQLKMARQYLAEARRLRDHGPVATASAEGDTDG
jgi:hypothetical protein